VHPLKGKGEETPLVLPKMHPTIKINKFYTFNKKCRYFSERAKSGLGENVTQCLIVSATERSAKFVFLADVSY
jgi:hypothetical protein